MNHRAGRLGLTLQIIGCTAAVLGAVLEIHNPLAGIVSVLMVISGAFLWVDRGGVQ